MAALLDAGLDLGGLAGCFLLIGLLSVVSFTFARLAHVLNVSILGVRPFAGVAAAIENTIVAGCNDGIAALEGAAAQFESGLIQALELLVAIPVLLAEGVLKALGYGWHAVISPLINELANKVQQLAERLDTHAAAIEAKVAGLLSQAHAYTDAQIAAAAGALATHAEAVARVAESAAEGYADSAVAKLRAAENAAIDQAASIAGSAARSAEAAATEALAKVKAIAIPIEKPLPSLDELAKITGAAALIASIPALATLVNTIAVETGLENQSCRGKVKQICQTDPAQWAALLGGLAAIGFGFSLRDLADIARPLVAELAPVIEQAA